MIAVQWSLDTSGAEEFFARLESEWDRLPVLEVAPGEGDEVKAVMAVKRGDAPLYPVGDAAVAELRDGYAAAMAGGDGLEAAADAFLEEIKDGIRSGLVGGPTRSAKWIARKGSDVNMVGLTGSFVENLQVRFLNRAGGFTRDLSSGQFVRV